MGGKCLWGLTVFSLLAGCTERGPDEGIVVRNPGDTRVSVADGDDLIVTAAMVEGYEVQAYGCDSDTGPENAAPPILATGPVNLLEETFDLPGGVWCDVTLKLDSSLSLTGVSGSGGEVSAELALDTLFLGSVDGFMVDGGEFILELAAPNWISSAALGISDSEVQVTVADGHPSYSLMVEAFTGKSGLYQDLNADGALSEDERTDGQVAATQTDPLEPCWVAAGRQTRVTTFDEEWEAIHDSWMTSSDNFTPFRNLTFTGRHMVAVGGDTMEASVSISNRCGEWTDLVVSGAGFSDATYFDDKLVLVGLQGRRTWTSDFVTWNEANTRAGCGFCRHSHKGTLVAVGTNGAISLSNDGANWSEIDIGGSGIVDVTASSDALLAVQGSRILYSATGTTWTQVKDATRTLTSVAYGDGRVVAVGDKISLSIEESRLTDAYPVFEYLEQDELSFRDVQFAEGFFFAVADDGIYQSKLGLEWERLDHQDSTPIYLAMGFADFRPCPHDKVFLHGLRPHCALCRGWI